jgi:DNA polymerase-1
MSTDSGHDAGGPAGLSLFPCWELPVQAAEARLAAEVQRVARYSIPWTFRGAGLHVLDGEAGARRLVAFAATRPVAYAGLACAWRPGRPPVPLPRGRTWSDPRAVEPLLLALVLAERFDTAEAVLHPFVLDCRQPGAARPLADLLGRPIPFAVRRAAVALPCLWQLGLPAPERVWDCWVAERAMALGPHHPRYAQDGPADDAEEARARAAAEEAVEQHCALPLACLRHGVSFPFAGHEGCLREAWASHPPAAAFTQDLLDAVAAEARALAQLYPAQAQAALGRNALTALVEVEMPWAVVCARQTWDGVRLDPAACARLLDACRRHDRRLATDLAALGIPDPGSRAQLADYFGRAGLLDAFRAGSGHSFDDDRLEAVGDRCPAARLICSLRKVRRLLSDRLLTGELVGADGRLHPEHRPLGADTGRNTMRAPNVGGVGRALRPLVIPEPGRGVGEVDLVQIEVLIAAAVYDDGDLVRMANGRDVYVAMARRYYAGRLSPEELALPDRSFKKRHRALRERMKVVTLAVIYGITPAGLSGLLGVSEARAAEERERFLGLFPALAHGLAEASSCGAARGYAEACSGLRRYRARGGAPTPWESNWLANTPVQGSCAVILKTAGVRLYRRYGHHGARLLLPMHDSLVFEAPLSRLEKVAKVTAEELRGAVQVHFPALDPRVEINIDHPASWNKDSKWRSLRLWMIDPELAREFLES